MTSIHALATAAALTLGLAGTADAQVDVGLKVGLTFATLSESSLSPDFKSQTGFVAGVHIGIPLGSLRFQPEALIAQQGTNVQGATETTGLEVNYLVIPANLRFNLGSGGIQPFILGGPYAAFKLSCTIEHVGDCADDVDLSGSDWGLGFGGGINLGSFFAEARYNLGLKDISNVSQGFDSKQRVFMVMVGVSF